MAKNYYDILGVKKGATKDEIKKAFHKLAHQHHPDKKGGDEAKFKEVSEAYQVLSDDKKRSEYDTYGQTFAGGAPGGGQGFEGFGGFGGGGFEGVDLGDIFGDIFSGGFGGRGNATPRGADIQVDIEITFEESIFGVKRSIVLGKTATCETCKGTGGKPGTKMKQCQKCDGKGAVIETRRSIFGAIQTRAICPVCAGKGEVPEEKCPTCKGDAVRRKQETIPIDVPSGIRDGEIIRLSGMGEAVPHGETGDLYIRIHVKPHPVYRREGNDLTMTLNVKLSDALLGSTYTVTWLDKTPIEVRIPEGVKFGDILRVKGKGVPSVKGRAGDLNIRVNIQTPSKLNSRVKKLIEELQKEGI